jgi:hypothetical protein
VLQGATTVKKEYLELTRLIERLHRRFLDLLRAELNRLGIRDINSVQALLIANIGKEEIAIRDLVERGYYQARTSPTTSRSWPRWATCSTSVRRTTEGPSAFASPRRR